MSERPREEREAPENPSRRQMLVRLGQSLAVGGVAGLGTCLLYDGKQPVRTHVEPDRVIPDHRVKVPPATPAMVIVRGKDPAKNVRAGLQRMGGMGRFIAKGDRVLIKPNIGWDRMPTQAANTDPQVVAALVRSCLEAGAAQVVVADHPINDPERCFTRSGVLAAAREAGGRVEIPDERRFFMVSIPGQLGRWPVFEPFILADKIINVPVVKHHSLTRATLGMKNWYGILGGRRNQLHQRIDDSVVELTALMRPTLTVMDGTRILMRNGPTGGSLADVKQGDVLALSLDPVAIDAWGVSLLGAEPETLRWLQLGQRRQLGVIDFRSLRPVEITAT